ncbi:uncharacterized protein LOC117290107 [Asterias rubens]|uniref:uncharacterized protein LOC117290107 n=1 Tax=Asterias rubens TaxID=7604 RepID=UPI0014559E13|nr:uncharacterized protein LOC117290107 [Asterias rubens]
MTLVFALLVAAITGVAANNNDPHVYPEQGPFIEGWYARITDSSSPRSFGVLFGRVLPKPLEEGNNSTSPPLTYISIIRSDGNSAPFVVAEAYPDEDTISVTVSGGRPVTGNPDNWSPSHFEWVAKPFGFFNVTPDSTTFDFTIGDDRFSGNFGPPSPWGPHGKGPEDWLGNVPFIPLHWFVYSLATPGDFTWENDKTGLRIQGDGTMHQEKNWGNGFPASWIWMQGVNSTSSTAFAGTFGVLGFGPLSVPAHLFGVRDFNTELELNFHPVNSMARVTSDGCSGEVSIEVVSFRHKLVIRARAPPSTLQKCLRGPTERGFENVLVESFAASVDIAVYERRLFGYRLLSTQIFEGAALEFGGEELCPENPCV